MSVLKKEAKMRSIKLSDHLAHIIIHGTLHLLGYDHVDNGKVKISWTNPEDIDFKGVKVIKNAYRVPLSSHDGQKLYAGVDSYTFDDFGAKDVSKYYAIFTYDDVPNYSEPIILEYKAK